MKFLARTLLLVALCLGRIAFSQTLPFEIGGQTMNLQRAEPTAGAFLRAFRANTATGKWEVDVIVTNGSMRVLRGPMVLRFDTAQQISPGIVGATVDAAGQPFVILTPMLAAGELKSGEALPSFTLALGDGQTRPVLAPAIYSAPDATAAALVIAQTLTSDGLPLENVTVAEIGSGEQRILNAGRGGWASLELRAGVRGWRFSAEGKVSVIRLPPIGQAGTVSEIPSARLTDRVAVGATIFGGQTIPAPVPVGWSPLAAAEIPSGTTVLELAEVAGTGTVLTRWDEAVLGWRVVRDVETGGRSVVVEAAERELVAALQPDASPSAPPVGVVGELITAILAVTSPADLAATASVNPTTRTASRNPALVQAEATVEFTSASATGVLSSGLTAPCEVFEEYILRDGTRRVLPSYRMTLVAYQRPAGAVTGSVTARFALRPFQLLGSDELVEVRVRVNVLKPASFAGATIDAAGGVISSGGVRLAAAQGVYDRPNAVILREISFGAATQIAPAGLEIVSAFELSGGPPTAGAKLFPSFTAQAPNANFVLARAVFDEGRHGFQPVARFTSLATGSLRSSEPTTGGLIGIDGPGQFVLFRTGAPEALVSGVARDANGAAKRGLVVRRGPWTAFSDDTGAFRLLAPAGTSELTVADAAGGDVGTRALQTPSNLAPVQASIDTVARGPQIVSISPPNGASNVLRVAAITISFDKPLNAGSLIGNRIVLRKPNGDLVNAPVSLNLKGTVATLLPENPLDPSVTYTVSVSPDVADIGGKKIEGPLTFSFTTESDAFDRIAGRLTIYEPLNGIMPLSGSPGTADPEAVVILVNETSGRTATVLSKVDGSFTNNIAADVDDVISAVLVSRNGERVTLSASRQVFLDGRVGLFNAGGVVEAAGENGPVQAIVEAGAINGKNIFQVEAVSIAQLQQEIGPIPAEDNTKILGGMRIGATGPAMSQPVDVSIPINVADLNLEADESPTNRVFALCVPRIIDGVSVFEIVDNLEFENGRLVSHSPPYAGPDLNPALSTFAAIMMGFFPLKQTVVGEVVRVADDAEPNITDEDVRNGRTQSGKPITKLPGAVVTADRQPSQSPNLRAGAFVARGNRFGFYALSVPLNPFVPDPILMRARHPSLPNQSVTRVFTPEGLRNAFAIGTVVNFIFRVPAGSATDDVGPVVTPAPPAANLPLVNPVTVDFILRDGESEPQLDSVEFVQEGSIQVDNGQPVNPGAVLFDRGAAVQEGPLTYRIPVTFRVSVASLVNIRTRAHDSAGNVREQTHRFRFAPSPLLPTGPLEGDPNDETAPQLLSITPGRDQLITSPQLLFRFSEPITPEATNLSLSLSINPAVGMTAKLSPNQQELLVDLSGLRAGQDYSLTLHQAGVRDLKGNFIARGHQSTFKVPPAPAADLQETLGAAGSVEIGAFSFTIMRRGRDGDLLIHQLGDTNRTQVAGRLSLPFFPRSIEAIGSYAYKRMTNGPIETNVLVAVAGGVVGTDNAGQVAWIVNVSNPAAPVRLASEIVSIDPAAVISGIKWRPPYFFMNEARADSSVIEAVNLQAFILGSNGSLSTSGYVFGVDANDDGDFVDAGDSLPIPEKQSLFGLERASELGSSRFADDFDALDGGAFMAAILGPHSQERPRLQIVFHRGEFIGTGDAGSTPGGIVFQNTTPRRVLIDIGVPLETEVGRTFITVAIVLVDGGVEIYDLTNPVAPALVRRIPLGLPTATALTILRSGDDEYIVGTKDGIYALKRSLMTLPPDESGKPSGLNIVYSGAVIGRSTGASELDFVSATGGNARMILREPALKIVAAPGFAVTNIGGIIAQGETGVRAFLDAATEFSFLMPAMTMRCPTGPSPIGDQVTPPNPRAHHYVVVRAAGINGPTINVAVESLDLAQNLTAPLGKDFPAVILTSQAAAMGLLRMMPATQALVARRLSDNPFSEHYNTYVTDPFLVVLQQLELDEKEFIANDGRKRSVIWSGEHIRCSIDPLDISEPLRPVGSRVANFKYLPGISRTYRALRPEFRDSPNPSFASAAPRHGGVDLQGGEFRHPQTDIFVEGSEQSLSLARVYESRSRYVGAFGRGWDFNLNLRLQEYPLDLGAEFRAANCLPGRDDADLAARAGDVMFYDGAGGAFRFHRISAEHANEARKPLFATDPAINEFLGPNGAARIQTYYESPESIFSALYKFSDGTWWMVGPTGIQMFFDTTGRATKIHGRSKESEILFSYRDDGKLDRVEGDRGASLEFGYYYAAPAVLNSGGLLDRVSSRAAEYGRIAQVRVTPSFINSSAVEYEYDDNGNLLKTKPAGGAETVHTYDEDDPNLLLSVGRGDGTEQPGIRIGYNASSKRVDTATINGETRTYTGSVDTAADRKAAGPTTVLLARNNISTPYKIDDRGRPTEFAGRPFGADDQGRVTKVADDLNEVTLVYDINNPVYRFRGNLLRTERRPLAGTGVFMTETTYDDSALNRPESLTDVNGILTDISYLASEIRQVTGGLVTRRLAQNDFDQTTQTELSGNGLLQVSSILTATSPADRGLVNGEQSGGARASTISRDTRGRIQESREGARVQTIHYNSDSQPDHMFGTAVPDVTISYKDFLKETETVASGGQAMTEAYSYGDSRHKSHVTKLVSQETGLPAIITDFHYDENARLKELIVAGELTQFGYDGVRQTSLIGPGRNHSSAFDESGRLTNLVQNGISASFVYDGNGRMESSSQQGVTTTFEYDDGARLSTRLKSKTVEDDNGVLIEESFTYDAAGRVETTTSQGGRVKRFTWFPDNKLKSVTIDGVLLQDTDRDTAGRVTRARVNDIETTYSSFDAATGSPLNETMVFLPSGRSLTRVNGYDINGRVQSISLPIGSYEFRHDGFGNLNYRKDADGVEIKKSFSPSGKLLSSTFGDGTFVTMQFTPERRLDRVETPLGNMQFAYDATGQARSMILPDGVTTEFNVRNQFFEPEQVIFGGGEVTQTQSFNPDTGRLEGITAGNDEMSFSHDGLGRRTESDYNGNSVTTIFNAHGEAVGEDTDAGTWSVELDARNRLLAEEYPSGLRLEFGPDGFGLPTAVVAAGITIFQWLGVGLWSEIRLTGGLVLTRSYDPAVRLTGLRYGNTARFDYRLTPGGRVLSEERQHESRFDVYTRVTPAQAMRIERFDFGATNDAGAGAQASLTNVTFFNGELRAPAQGTLIDPRGYFPAISFTGQRVVSADGDPVEYNRRGGVTNTPLYVRLPGALQLTKVRAALEYDGFGMLRSVSRDDGVVVTYDRDGLCRIIRREVTGPTSRCEPGVRQYVWKGPRLLEELDEVAGNFELVRRYIYIGDTLVLVQRAATPGGAMVDFVPLLNLTGSICGYAARDGTLVETISYSAYGYPLFKSANDAAGASLIGNTVLFHGAWFDPATGMYQMGSRNLHPILARFIQRDNALFAESLAFYSSFNGDPASYTDARGAITGVAEAVQSFERGKELTDKAVSAVKAGRELSEVLDQAKRLGGTDEVKFTAGGVATANFLGALAELSGFGGDEKVAARVKEVTAATTLVKDHMETAQKVGTFLGEVNGFIDKYDKIKNFRVAFWTSDPKNAPHFGKLHELGAFVDLRKIDDLEGRFPKDESPFSRTSELSRGFLGKLESQREEYDSARFKLMVSMGKNAASLGKYMFAKTLADSDRQMFKVAGGVIDTADAFFSAIEAYGGAMEADDLALTFKAVNGTANQLTDIATSSAGRAAVGAAFKLGFEAGKTMIVFFSDPDVATAYLAQTKQFSEDGGWFTVAGGMLSTVGADGAAQLIQDLHDTSLEDYAKPIIEERNRNQRRTEYYLKGLSAP